MENMSDFIKNKGWWQFLKFAIVGISNTFISEITYVILVYFRMHYLPASFIGFTISTINAFYWNNKYVFRQPEERKEPLFKVFGRTYVAYLGSYLLSAALLVFWIDILHVSNWMVWPETWCLAHGFEQMDRVFLGKAFAAFLNLLLT